MSSLVNVAISDPFILRDDSNVVITGATAGQFTTKTAYALPSGSPSITPTLTEIGAGQYAFTFTPTTAGDWALHYYFDNGTTTAEFLSTFDVLAVNAAVPITSATNAGLSVTLTELRRRVASRFGDYTMLTATGSGSTTQLVDALNVNAGAENYGGRYLLFVSGTAGNIGKVARVTATNDSTSTLTFIPAVTSSTAANDVVDVFNKRGTGFSVAEYTNAINNAIDDAFPLGVIDLQSTVAAFSMETPEVTVPANMVDVYDLEWQDGSGDWHRIPKSTRSGEYGWRVNAPAGTLILSGYPGSQADGSVLRVSGYGRQDTLTNESDTCVLNAEYVVSRACYHLAAGSLMRDSAYAQLTPMFQQESERKRLRLRTIRRPNTERVRSA